MASSYITSLMTRRDAIAAELAELDGLTTDGKNRAGGKPNVSHSDGGTHIDHHKYKMGLYDELKQLDKLIREAAETDAAIDGTDGAFEIATEVL